MVVCERKVGLACVLQFIGGWVLPTALFSLMLFHLLLSSGPYGANWEPVGQVNYRDKSLMN